MPEFDAIKDRLGELLPVVMVFVLWIIFSFLGSKLRKQDQGAQQAQETPSLQEKFLEMISPGAASDAQQHQAAPKSDFERLESESSRSLTTVKNAPPVTAKPITPRWWGA